MSFFRAYIEITNNCGLNCSFCTPKKEKANVMSLATYEKILKELNSKEIALHVLGDPLLNKDLKKYLDLAYFYDFKVSLTTSGFYLNKHNFAIFLHASIKQFNISLNSFNKNNTKLTLDGYLEPIFQFLDFKLKTDSNTIINLRLWNLNDEKNDEKFNKVIFEKLEKHFCIKLEYKRFKNKSSIRIANKVRVHFDDYFLWPSLNNQIYQNSPCLGLNSQIAFLVDGKVVPCCLDTKADVCLGNINNENLSNILEKSSKITKGLKDGFPTSELCKRCSYRLRFLKKELHARSFI